MPTIKTYQLTGRITSSAYPAYVNGVKQWIKFVGGQISPNFISGKYSTKNEAVQKGLESSPFFNKKFKLVKTVEIKEPEPEPLIKENDHADDGVLKMIEDVTDLREAKNYLVNEYPGMTSMRKLPNKSAVLNFAASVNIEFPNLL